MAKATAVKIVRVASFRGARGKAGALAKRGATAAANAARQEQHRAGALIAAGIVGFAEARRVQLPHVALLGVPGTYGVVAYVAARMTKNKMLDHAATGLLSVAVYQLAKAQSGTSGEFGAEPEVGDLVIE